MISVRAWVCVLMFMVLGIPAAQAQSYPDQPIRIIVPYPAGGMPDRIARDVAVGLKARLKQSVIVENYGGAAGNIGFDYVARQPADGYTLLMAPASNLTVQPLLFKSLSYNLNTDFTPISLLVESPQLLVVNPSLPVHSVKELVEYSKTHANKVNFGMTIGSFSHLAAEMLRMDSHADFTAIPYQGSNLAMNDLLSGQVQFMFNDVVSTNSFVRAGKLRPLAIAFNRRVPWLPNVPTMEEEGYKGFEAVSWYAMIARSGTPKPIVDLLAKELSAIMKDPALEKRYEDTGAFTVGSTPQELAAFNKAETKKWTTVVKAIGLQPN